LQTLLVPPLLFYIYISGCESLSRIKTF